ncbi:MAG: hypothetical protein FWH33_05905 [Oscillospiraceae bacterium]|nr:hypothetical protein [Oscillospiraceae bacterium]
MSILGIIGGAGLLGTTTAFCVAARGLFREIILSDVRKNLAKSHAMDIEQAICETTGVKLSTGEIDELKTCDIILNAAGIPEMKASSRDDYLAGNIAIYNELAEIIKRWETCPIIVSASNPIDVLNYELYRATDMPRERFIGFNRNDTLRFKWAISEETGIPVSLIDAMVIGEHGDKQVPLFSTLTRRDAEEAPYLSDAQKENIIHRISTWFSEYQNLESGRSSGWTSGVGLARILSLVTTESDEVCSCSVIPDGEYGLRGLSIGLPVRLGKSGVREIVEIELSADERMQLTAAAEKIKQTRT